MAAQDGRSRPIASPEPRKYALLPVVRLVLKPDPVFFQLAVLGRRRYVKRIEILTEFRLVDGSAFGWTERGITRRSSFAKLRRLFDTRSDGRSGPRVATSLAPPPPACGRRPDLICRL